MNPYKVGGSFFSREKKQVNPYIDLTETNNERSLNNSLVITYKAYNLSIRVTALYVTRLIVPIITLEKHKS